MTITLDHLADFAAQHPWPTAALIFLLGVVLPAVWSARRHVQAMAVLRALLDATVAIVAAVRAPGLRGLR